MSHARFEAHASKGQCIPSKLADGWKLCYCDNLILSASTRYYAFRGRERSPDRGSLRSAPLLSLRNSDSTFSLHRLSASGCEFGLEKASIIFLLHAESPVSDQIKTTSLSASQWLIKSSIPKHHWKAVVNRPTCELLASSTSKDERKVVTSRPITETQTGRYKHPVKDQVENVHGEYLRPALSVLPLNRGLHLHIYICNSNQLRSSFKSGPKHTPRMRIGLLILQKKSRKWSDTSPDSLLVPVTLIQIYLGPWNIFEPSSSCFTAFISSSSHDMNTVTSPFARRQRFHAGWDLLLHT